MTNEQTTTGDSKRYQGAITRLVLDNGDKKGGYGFINSPQKPYTRIYFHWSGIKPGNKNFAELNKGDTLEFDLIEYIEKVTNVNKGWRAINIDVVSGE